MSLNQADIVVSNNPAAYGVAYADQIAGHRSVADLTALYNLADCILSKSGDNTDDDAIGQQWYVVSEECNYRLEDWDNRTSALGWQKVENVNTVSFVQSKTSGTELGKITINDTTTSIYGSEVSFQLTQTSGTEIGTITIDEITTTLYSTNEYDLPTATSSALGGVKLGSDTELTIVANSVSSVSDRTYAIQLNSDDLAVVNIPWTDTTYNEATTSTSGLMSAEDKAKINAITEDADSVSFSQTKTSGTEIGEITINNTSTSIYASEVSVDLTLTSGIEVGKITIDGITTTLYSQDDSETISDLQSKITTAEDNITDIQSNIEEIKNYTVNGYEISSNPVLNKSDIDLGNVDNTSDLDKPISTATLEALDEKVNTDLLANIAFSGKAEDVSVTDTLGYFDSTNVEDALLEVMQPLDTHLLNNTNGMNHIPSGGASNLILVWDSAGRAKWDSIANLEITTEDMLAYGVEWDTTVADPILTRIGNTSLHKSLPIQSGMYGCICQGSTIRYRLADDDWRFKRTPDDSITVQLTVDDNVITIQHSTFSTLQYEKQWVKINDISIQIDSINIDEATAILVNNDYTGTLLSGSYSCELGSVRNGYDGTVRVYVPGFYYKSVSEDTIRRVYLSTSQIDSTYSYQEPVLIDAYKCTLLDTVPENMGYLSTLSANTFVSIVNTNTYCRGGNNNSEYDQYLDTDPTRTLLGKPRTAISRVSARNYLLEGSHLMSYNEYKNIFYWLYVVEYANFNCLATYNSSLDENEYEQGGLSNGVTTMNINVWAGYNGLYPLTPCGYLDNLGNGSGIEPQVLESFELSITPSTNWDDWTSGTYYDSGSTYNYATMNMSSNTLTITNVNRSGNILYTSALNAVGQTTYTISGLEDGLSIEFTCSGQTTQTASSDGQIIMDWGTDGAQTRYIYANFTGNCNITITCDSVETITAEYPSQSITVNRWRGFDNPFGDTWTFLDGIIIDASDHGTNMDHVYTCSDPSKFGDTLTEDYVNTAESIHTEGYIKAFDLGDTANIIASEVGGSYSTYMCDYHYTGDINSTLRMVLVGGSASYGSTAGLGYLYSGSAVSHSTASAGFRSVSALVS